jgi:hypothetical protein
MKKSLLLLTLICSLCLLNSCGSGSGSSVPLVATHLSVAAPGTASAGTSFNVTLTALDASNRTVSGYSGTVLFTSSDGQPVQPASVTLTGGTGTFPLTLSIVGSPTITAAVGSLIGSSSAIAVGAGALARFTVALAGNSFATIGTPFNITVTAMDAGGNTITNYSGTVQFTSSDGHAVLPGDSTLNSGVGAFPVTLNTSGGQTISVNDKASSSISGVSNVISASGPATHFSVSPTGSAATRANLVLFVSALDASNNTSTGYTGTVKITSSDANAILPPNGTLTFGSGNFQIVLETAGTQTVTATDTGAQSIAGTSSSIAVAATNALAISSGPPPNGTVNSTYGPTSILYERCVPQFPGFSLRCTPCVPNSIAGCGVAFPNCLRVPPNVACILTLTLSGFPLTGTGGIPPYSWTASSLPPGLAVGLEAVGKTFIRGTPIPGAAGTYQTSVTLNDAGMPQTPMNVIYTIVIANPPPPVVDSAKAPPFGAINQPYSFTFTATGGLPPLGPWSETGALPPGMQFTNSTGALSGTPTVAAAYPITVMVQDSASQNSAPQNFSIQIFPHGFGATGSMANARLAHTATLLNNGKVLVAGGADASGHSVATAELYDPSTGSFTSTGSMVTAREYFAAALLSSGKVLVTGGLDATGNPLASAEIYDPGTGTFSATPKNMTIARASHTATLLNTGKVLIAGWGNATAELFDPATGAFTATGSMLTARVSHTATLLSTGKVLLTGGIQGAPPATTVLAEAELYDPVAGTFSPTTGSLATARELHAASLLTDGRVIVTGGTDSAGNSLASAEVFDPASETFTAAKGAMGTARSLHTSTTLKDGTVLVVGGNNVAVPLATAEVFDPVAETFAPTGSMGAPRAAHTATLLNDGRVLVVGGNGAGVLATAELYQ